MPITQSTPPPPTFRLWPAGVRGVRRTVRQVPDRGGRGGTEAGAEGSLQDLRQGRPGLHHHRCAQGDPQVRFATMAVSK